MAAPLGTGAQWLSAMTSLTNLITPRESVNSRNMIADQRKITREDIKKDAKVHASILQNDLFKKTLSRMVGLVEPLDLGTYLEEVLANPVYGSPTNKLLVCWLQPYDANNALKKGRAQYTGDLPNTNKLPEVIDNAFIDAAFNVKEIRQGVNEILTPGSYIDPATRNSAGPTKPNVSVWDGPAGYTNVQKKLIQDIFTLLGLNTQPNFLVQSFQGIKGADNSMTITLEYKNNIDFLKTYSTLRDATQQTPANDDGTGVYCDGNKLKNDWFTTNASAAVTDEAVLWLLMKELGDTLQVIYAKLYMGGDPDQRVCLFSPDRTVLIRSRMFGVPICYKHVVDVEEKIWENLGQCTYYYPDFNPRSSFLNIMKTHYDQCINHNNNVKNMIAAALIRTEIEVGGITLPLIDTIRTYYNTTITGAIDAANAWLTAVSFNIIDSVPAGSTTTQYDAAINRFRKFAALATADPIVDRSYYINNVRRLFKNDAPGARPASTVRTDPGNGIVTPVTAFPVDPIFTTGMTLHNHLKALHRADAAASAAKKRAARALSRSATVLSNPLTMGLSRIGGGLKDYSAFEGSTLNTWTSEFNTTETFSNFVFTLLRYRYNGSPVKPDLSDYGDVLSEDLIYEYLEDQAGEFVCVIYTFLNYIGRTPTNINMLNHLIDNFLSGDLYDVDLDTFRGAYEAIERDEQIRLLLKYTPREIAPTSPPSSFKKSSVTNRRGTYKSGPPIRRFPLPSAIKVGGAPTRKRSTQSAVRKTRKHMKKISRHHRSRKTRKNRT
jgi:hypothetical protein